MSKGNEKVAQSAKESVFIYARMAERWSEIMHEYGNKIYSREDYIKAHPIVMNQLAGEKRYMIFPTKKNQYLAVPLEILPRKSKGLTSHY